MHQLSKDLEIYFLEIPKYRNKPVESLSPLERWLAYFANKLSLEEKEELAMQDNTIGAAIQASDRFMMDERLYWDYINREAAIRDYNNDFVEGQRIAREEGIKQGVEQGIKQGVEQGVKQGVEQGVKQDKEETAISMLRDDFAPAIIAKHTRLSLERIAELREKL